MADGEYREPRRGSFDAGEVRADDGGFVELTRAHQTGELELDPREGGSWSYLEST